MEMRGRCQAALRSLPAKLGCRDSPGAPLTPAALPEGLQSRHPPGEWFILVTSSSLLETAPCKCRSTGMPRERQMLLALQ